MASSIEAMHKKAIATLQHARGRLVAHKQIVGTTVTRTLTAVEAGIGGGAAAAVDFYMGDQAEPIPEAMVGPVPLVMAGAIGLTAVSILMQKEDWSVHVAGFAAGMGGAAAYAESLRFLRAHESGVAPAPKVHT